MKEPKEFQEQLSVVDFYFAWLRVCNQKTNILDNDNKKILCSALKNMSNEIIKLGTIIGYDKDKGFKEPKILLFNTDERLKEVNAQAISFHGINTIHSATKKAYNIIDNLWKSMGFDFVESFKVESCGGIELKLSGQFKDVINSFSSKNKDTLEKINQNNFKKMSTIYDVCEIHNSWYIKDTDANKTRLLTELFNQFGDNSLIEIKIGSWEGVNYIESLKFFVLYEKLTEIEKLSIKKNAYPEYKAQSIEDKECIFMDCLRQASTLFFVFKTLYKRNGRRHKTPFDFEESRNLYMNHLEILHAKIVGLFEVETEIKKYVDDRNEIERNKNIYINRVEEELVEKSSVLTLRKNLKELSDMLSVWWGEQHFDRVSDVSVSRYGTLSARFHFNHNTTMHLLEDIETTINTLESQGFEFHQADGIKKIALSQDNLDKIAFMFEERFPAIRIVSFSTSPTSSSRLIINNIDCVFSGTSSFSDQMK